MQHSAAIQVLEKKMAEYLQNMQPGVFSSPYDFKRHAEGFLNMFNQEGVEVQNWIKEYVRFDQLDSVNRNILTINVLPAENAQGADVHLRTYRLPVSNKAHFASVQDYLSVMLRSAKGAISLLPETDRAANEAEIIQALYHSQAYIQQVLEPSFSKLFQSEGFPSRSRKEQKAQFKILHKQALDVCRDFRKTMLEKLMKVSPKDIKKEELAKKLKYAEAKASEAVRPVLINWQRTPSLDGGTEVCVFKEEVRPQTKVTLSSEAVPEATALRNDLDSTLWKWQDEGFTLVDHISRSAALGSELLAEKLNKTDLETVFSNNLGTLLQQGSINSTNPEVSCCYLTVLSPVDIDAVQSLTQQGKPMVEAGFAAAKKHGGIYLNHGVNMGRQISKDFENNLNAEAIQKLFCMVLGRMDSKNLYQGVTDAVSTIESAKPEKALKLIFEKMKSFPGKGGKYGSFPPEASTDLWLKLARYLEVVDRQHSFLARKAKFVVGNPVSDQEKSCMAPVFLADLVQALGIPLHVTCKSGKDRTGYFDEALKVYHSLLLEKPNLDILHDKEDRAAWLARIDVFMKNAASCDVCRQNTSGVLQVGSKNYAGDTDYDIGNELAKLYKDVREEPAGRDYKVTQEMTGAYQSFVEPMLHPPIWQKASAAELSAYWKMQLGYTQTLLLMMEQPRSVATASPTLFTGTRTPDSPSSGSPRSRFSSEASSTSEASQGSSSSQKKVGGS